jgi:hypothetical protein
MRTRHRTLASIALVLSLPALVRAAELHPATITAFNRYVTLTEAQGASPTPALWIDTLSPTRQPGVQSRLRAGTAVIERLRTSDNGVDIDVPDGLIHHWVGTVFIPGRSADDALKLLQDFNRHADLYAPAVQRSRVLSRQGDDFTVFLRFYQKKGITVVVNSDHEARFVRVAPGQVRSRIISTRIQEVEDAGGPDEREKPVGRDGGYLWRLNTYWRFVERAGGVYVQCESVTLTRDIPFGLNWLIGPFVTSIPRESLAFTLDTTRRVLLGSQAGAAAERR